MKGFTLIELVVVFLIVSTISSVSVASFSSYNNSQVFNGSVSDLVSTLSVARSRAISQVKPASCGASTLDGYEVRVTVSGSDYEMDVVCGGVRTVIERKKLAQTLNFSSSSMPAVLFNVSTGSVSLPGSISVTGFGKSNTLTISKTGTVRLTNGGEQAIGSVPPTPTPTPLAGCYPAIASWRWYGGSVGCRYIYPGYGDYCDESCGGQTGAVPTPTPTTGAVPTPTPTIPSLLPDLVITSVTAPSTQARNTPFTISITVTNQGSATATGTVYLGIYYDMTPPPSYSTTINAQTAFNASLAPQASQIVTYGGGVFSTSGSHTIHVIADRTQTISESNESNNLGGPQTINISKNIFNSNILAQIDTKLYKIHKN